MQPGMDPGKAEVQPKIIAIIVVIVLIVLSISRLIAIMGDNRQ
jgi:flagellar basal body-associated protein FliL